MERTKLKVKEMMGMLDGYIVGESRNGDPRFTSDDASEVRERSGGDRGTNKN